MIEETVQVLRVENDYLWVEGVQRSACGSCAVRQGCGQGLLARFGFQPVRIRVSLDGRDAKSFHIGQNVTIGVADNVVVRGSLLIYLLPLLMLLSGIWLGERLFANEFAAIICGLLALCCAGFFSGRLSNSAKQRSKLQARLLDM